MMAEGGDFRGRRAQMMLRWSLGSIRRQHLILRTPFSLRKMDCSERSRACGPLYDWSKVAGALILAGVRGGVL